MKTQETCIASKQASKMMVISKSNFIHFVFSTLLVLQSVQAATAPLANDKKCSTSEQCASRSCQLSRCADKVALGVACYKDNMCLSGSCQGKNGRKVCAPNPAAITPTPTPAMATTTTTTITLTSISVATTTMTTVQATSTPLCAVPGQSNSLAPGDNIINAFSPQGGISLAQCRSECLLEQDCKTYTTDGSTCELYMLPLYKTWQYCANYAAKAYEIDCVV